MEVYTPTRELQNTHRGNNASIEVYSRYRLKCTHTAHTHADNSRQPDRRQKHTRYGTIMYHTSIRKRHLSACGTQHTLTICCNLQYIPLWNRTILCVEVLSSHIPSTDLYGSLGSILNQEGRICQKQTKGSFPATPMRG